MKRKLKHWILLLICGVILWLGLVQKQAIGLVEDAQILHLLNRLSFGPTFGQIEQVRAKGVETYIQEQLSPESIPESSQLKLQLSKLETLIMSPRELFQKYVPNPQMEEKKGRELSKEEKDKLLQKRWRVLHQAVEGRLARAIASKRQLQEVMVDFWFNHFNVYGKKAIASIWVGDYENEIRTHVLGHFRDLLEVTARHPAMLLYLDNEVNTDPNSPGAQGRFKGLNENYARELMELHTLGVDGGYTQADVTALARIFTGWGIDRSGSKGDENGFFFDENRHDFSDKVFLGTTIKGSGIQEGERALDILAAHPSTARFISYKLAQYFVADEPPQSLVDKLAENFRNTDGDIRAVLDTLFHSVEFNDPQYYSKKFKTPYQYLISIVRAARIDNPDYKQLRKMLEQLGMPVYGCLTPDGYANTKDVWLNPDGMLRRISLATEIAIGALNKENPVNAEDISATLNANWSPHTKQVLDNSPSRLRTALMLGSPEMMYR